MDYTVVTVYCDYQLKEILEVELSEIGFDSFLESETGFEASMPAEAFEQKALEEALTRYQENAEIKWEIKQEAKQNWNTLWESNFPHVEINNELVVRAPFHQLEKKYDLELIVMPKMSFGTGHHATTSLMLQQQLKLDFTGKKVVDIGSGTGILGILAAKKGASRVDAFDIEDWAVENAKENAEVNGVTLQVQLGTLADVQLQPPYDVALANINKNVILSEIASYADLLKKGGYLLTSGYFEQDQQDIGDAALAVGLSKISANVNNGWCCMVFQKG